MTGTKRKKKKKRIGSAEAHWNNCINNEKGNGTVENDM